MSERVRPNEPDWSEPFWQNTPEIKAILNFLRILTPHFTVMAKEFTDAEWTAFRALTAKGAVEGILLMSYTDIEGKICTGHYHVRGQYIGAMPKELVIQSAAPVKLAVVEARLTGRGEQWAQYLQGEDKEPIKHRAFVLSLYWQSQDEVGTVTGITPRTYEQKDDRPGRMSSMLTKRQKEYLLEAFRQTDEGKRNFDRAVVGAAIGFSKDESNDIVVLLQKQQMFGGGINHSCLEAAGREEARQILEAKKSAVQPIVPGRPMNEQSANAVLPPRQLTTRDLQNLVIESLVKAADDQGRGARDSVIPPDGFSKPIYDQLLQSLTQRGLTLNSLSYQLPLEMRNPNHDAPAPKVEHHYHGSVIQHTGTGDQISGNKSIADNGGTAVGGNASTTIEKKLEGDKKPSWWTQQWAKYVLFPVIGLIVLGLVAYWFKQHGIDLTGK